MDDDTLLRIAENGVARFLIGGRDDTADTTADTFTTLCQDQAVPQDMVLGLHTRLQRISESARASIASASDPAAMVQQSLRHKQVVDEYRKALRNMLKAYGPFQLHGGTGAGDASGRRKRIRFVQALRGSVDHRNQGLRNPTARGGSLRGRRVRAAQRGSGTPDPWRSDRRDSYPFRTPARDRMSPSSWRVTSSRAGPGWRTTLVAMAPRSRSTSFRSARPTPCCPS